MIKRNNYDLVGVSSKKIASGFGNEVYKNGTRGWKYECFEVERDNDSYDSIDDESNENSSETESFPAPRYQTFDITRLTDSTLFLVKSLVNNECTENGRQPDEDQTVMAPDAVSYFQDMQRRINAIARTVKQLNESLKPKNEENIQASKHVTQPDQARPSIPVTEIEVLPKDIMVDQMLELWETADKDATIGKQAEKT
ncbi:hypothetical protein GmHk_20G057448 [Glycine max]|nr:hypothetical protein JHK85_056407 [Glycine max]KAH1189727.1 hypothetical protein GmHk_20G057448 [Glycine max]